MKLNSFYKLENRVSSRSSNEPIGTQDPVFNLISKRIRQLDDYSKRPQSFKKTPFIKLKTEMGNKPMPLHYHYQTHIPPMPNSRTK